MKTLIANQKCLMLILVTILIGFGLQGSYGQTITASVQQPLTEANLHGSVVTLTISGGTYERSRFTIERAMTVSGIDGVTVDTFGVDRVSNTEVTIELEYAGNIDADGTLTFTVGAGAIADYSGNALTATVPVTALEESLAASTASPLTEANLDGSVVTLTLTGRTYESFIFTIRDAVTISGIAGVTVGTFDVDRVSDTQVTVELTFNGDFDTDGTLTFTVGADAVAGYNEDFTAQFSVTALEESLAASMDGNYQTWHLPDSAIARLGKGSIVAVAFSSDDQRLTVASEIGVWLYDVATSRELALLPAESRVGAFSPDGTILALFPFNGTVMKLWDAATGTNIATLEGHTGGVFSAAFSPDGTILASGSWDSTVKLWDVATGTNIATLEGHTGGATSVSFSPDGTTLASGSYDGEVKLWDVATKQNTATLEGHTASVYSVSFSPDGATLASGSDDGEVKLWDVATGTNIATLEGHTGGVYSVSFSPDGTILASGSGDDMVKLWDVATGTNTATLEGHTDSVRSVSFSPDGTTLASGSYYGGVKLWDVATGTNIATLEGHTGGATSVSFSPDGTILASGSWDSTVKLWDVATGTHTATLEGHTEVRSVSFSPDGTTLASGSWDSTVKLWDVATGTNTATLEGHTGGVFSVSFSPDGTTLASGAGDGTVKLWDVATGTNTATLEGHTDRATSVSFSPDGTILASGSWDSAVKLWDVATGTNTATLEGTDRVWSVSFSPDGTTLASGSYYGGVKLWDVATGTNIATLEGHTYVVSSVSFSPDGTILASGSWDSTVTLWDVATGANTATLEGHADSVSSVSFSPDGTILASGSWDGTVTLWDVSEWMAPRPADVRGPSATKMNVTDGEEDADLEVLNRDGIIIEFDENIASSSLKLTYEDGTDLGWESTVKDNSVTLTPIEGEELVHETSYVVRGTVRDGVGNETDLTLTFVAVKPLGATPNALEADVNGDGVVNMADLVLVASNYGQTGENVADINGDGVVHIYDIILVAAQLETNAAAPSLHAKDLSMVTTADVKKWLSEAQYLKLTDATSQRGILFLEQLLAALIPKETALLANYPNPFNPETWIPYRLAEDAFVTLTIYDGSGQVIRTLDVGYQTAAFYESRSKAIYWNGRNEFGEGIASGVYFYHLSAGDFSATRKMLILK